MTFDSILAGLSALTAVQAIVGAGILMAAVGFALWAVDVVATFFESDDSTLTSEEAEAMIRERGVLDGDEGQCSDCDYWLSGDELIHALNNGYCPKCGGDI